MSRSPPYYSPSSDPDAFFFTHYPEDNPPTVESYEYDYLNHCTHSAAALGPDNWFVSKVDAYAFKSRRPHEVLILTLKKAPRMGQEPNHTEHRLALQRLMKPHRHVIQQMKNTDALSSTFQEPWEEVPNHFEKIQCVNEVYGPCPAKDGFQLLPFTVVGDSTPKHIAQIHLPEPPCLPPAIDCDAIIMNTDEELSLVKTIRRMEQVKLDMEEERHGPSSISGCRTSTSNSPNHISSDEDPPHYVSLTAFANLTWILHHDKQFYHHLSNDNCYWFTSMILHTLRLYTKQNIHVLGEKNIEIKWDEDLSDPDNTPLHSRALKKKKFFWERRYLPKLSYALDIVNSPSNLAIRKVIVSWRRRVVEFHEEIYPGRLNVIKFFRGVWKKR
ncbi:hypothetical protein Agabi119p4_2821 [Agaricus bisporus var. burnettii]|uniref:Uncharacterized protein n=1 Tax=Agaricus bisporus var. burnettii TaxID=192524 RepID=A0A8H7KIR1_AGABI|nr:hypothetical protein Agabi119p4_2821 [Agaricus bisporus var. burnettii]